MNLVSKNICQVKYPSYICIPLNKKGMFFKGFRREVGEKKSEINFEKSLLV